MEVNKKKKIRIVLTISWISVIFLGILLFRAPRKKILNDETLDPIPHFQDKDSYNFLVSDNLDVNYSQLYKCKSGSIPEYLNDLADSIDGSLERVESSSFVRWIKEDKEVVVYNIDSTVLNLYLENYPEEIDFSSVESFVKEYLNSQIEYFDIQVQVEGDTEIYTANRAINEDELVTGYGYSDFFYVQNGYLISARVLLAQLSKVEYSVPLIRNHKVIEAYLNTDYFPKDIVIYSSEIIELTPYTYEDFDPEFTYEKCLVNDITPKLYFSSCNQNYTYYSYKIEGTCDIAYENKLYTVPFSGFMNAVEPEYIKNE